MTTSTITWDTARDSGRGSGRVQVLCQTGSGQGLSPLVSPRAPRTNLIHGHTAPMPHRPHTTHGGQVKIASSAALFLAVARPRSGINTLIRVRQDHRFSAHSK